VSEGLSLFGDWEKAKEIVEDMGERWKEATTEAVLAEANFLRAKIVEGMREQAPGGAKYKPLSPLTLAVRSFAGFKGSKALIRSGDLRNAVVVKKLSDGAFVGVLRTAQGKGGENLVSVAEENEFGAGPIVIPITPKSRRFFHAALAHAGIAPPASAGGSGGGLAIAIVRIPARPTFGPVFEKFAKPDDVRARFYHHVAHGMKGMFGEAEGDHGE
jgi:hypothetical protein